MCLGRSKSALCFLSCISERIACRTTVCAVRPGSGHCWFAENNMNKTHATGYCHVSSFFCGWVSGIFPGGNCGEGEGFRDKRWSSARLEANAGVHGSTWLKWKFTVEMLRMPCVIHRHTTSLHLFSNFPPGAGMLTWNRRCLQSAQEIHHKYTAYLCLSAQICL